MLAEKKPWDIVKVYCFNHKELGHFVKDYKRVGHNLVQGEFSKKKKWSNDMGANGIT